MHKGKHRAPSRSGSAARATTAGFAVAGVSAGVMFAASPAQAATISDAEIASVAQNAGLAGCDGASLGTWVAVALAESGGDTDANAAGAEDSRGLWQINMAAHASWVGGADLYDPATNAWAAKKVCDMQGITAWSAYTNGLHSQYLARGNAAAAAVAGGTAAAVGTATVSTAATASPAVAAVAAGTGAAAATAAGSGWDGQYHSRYGYQADAVRAIQQKLRDSGRWIAVDGVFGWRTDAAVRDYQQRHGLLVDGIVGPQTHGHLFG